MRRLPPRSPLCPYTTLFRSAAGAAQGDAAEVDVASAWVLFRGAAVPGDGTVPVARIEGGGPGALERRRRTAVDPVGLRQDRKSTRLNSSHLVISYAVFCLKK